MARRKNGSTDQRINGSTSHGLMRLAAAARRAGVTVNQLQYYLYMQIIQPTVGRQLSRGRPRKGGTQRLFTPGDVRRIRMVKLLNDSGYPLREIREIFVGRRYRWKAKKR